MQKKASCAINFYLLTSPPLTGGFCPPRNGGTEGGAKTIELGGGLTLHQSHHCYYHHLRCPECLVCPECPGLSSGQWLGLLLGLW